MLLMHKKIGRGDLIIILSLFIFVYIFQIHTQELN